MTQTTREELYLQAELDEQRAAYSRLIEQQAAERKARRQERYREVEEAYRQADSWPEALRKNIELCKQYIEPDDQEDYFPGMIEACKKALDLWHNHEIAKAVAEEISRLERSIQGLKDTWREAVADRLEKSDPRIQFANVADSIRNDDLDSFLNW